MCGRMRGALLPGAACLWGTLASALAVRLCAFPFGSPLPSTLRCRVVFLPSDPLAAASPAAVGVVAASSAGLVLLSPRTGAAAGLSPLCSVCGTQAAERRRAAACTGDPPVAATSASRRVSEARAVPEGRRRARRARRRAESCEGGCRQSSEQRDATGEEYETISL